MAGEVAEPYRVLVIADFPTQFDEKSPARLAAIAAGGIPCGVLHPDRRRPVEPLPPDFSIDDLRPYCERLTWDGARLAWDDPDFGRYPLALDPPPPADFATREIQRVGAAAKDAKRVEVPFEFIAPPDDAWWTQDSRAGIDVPLGKSGATKRQHLELGHGTSQHVLVAGRTGSGKSTLMHAPDRQPRLELQPRRDRPLPDRLQERRRVQGLCDPRAAARERRGDRERARVRAQRLAAAGRRAPPPRRPVPRCRRARHQRLSERARHAPAPPDPPGRGRVPGVLRRGGQAGAGGRTVARPPGPARPGVRRPCSPGLSELERRHRAWVGARSARWRSGSRCSAARPTPT